MVDELHLEEAHYAAQENHWFVGYCKLGNVWDFQNKLVVIDDENVEITIEADSSTDNPRHIMSYGKLKNSEIVVVYIACDRR